MLGQVDVFWVVKVGIRGVEDGVDDTGLQVQQHSPGNVVLIICLQRSKRILMLLQLGATSTARA